MIIDMNPVKSEILPDSKTQTFEKIVIPGEQAEIPKTKEVNTSVKEILSDLNNSQDTVPSVPENTELDMAGMISEEDCTALLHTIYGLMAFLVKGEVPGDNIIVWRGKQMYIIMTRYHLQVKYLDLAFFGLGIASDCMLIYQSRKKEDKTNEEPEKMKEPPKMEV